MLCHGMPPVYAMPRYAMQAQQSQQSQQSQHSSHSSRSRRSRCSRRGIRNRRSRRGRLGCQEGGTPIQRQHISHSLSFVLLRLMHYASDTVPCEALLVRALMSLHGGADSDSYYHSYGVVGATYGDGHSGSHGCTRGCGDGYGGSDSGNHSDGCLALPPRCLSLRCTTGTSRVKSWRIGNRPRRGTCGPTDRTRWRPPLAAISPVGRALYRQPADDADCHPGMLTASRVGTPRKRGGG
jgi:hypothetical protein